ncbi:MAG: Nif3-like dinuclear metal center hexameric protein [Candidatus Aminicenantes bacterium]|nr:Nif3-like dinuclear metal center hexameric protein [Candidatus Aminicenantes bacterium]
MNRRKFIQVSGSFALGSAVYTRKGISRNRSVPLKALDVNKYLRSLCPVSEPTVDRIVIGDPETVVTKMGTCWMPYWKTLQRAVNQGINTLVTHEPAFYSTWGLEREEDLYWEKPEVAKQAYLDLIQKKKQWITKQGLVIVRCHDVMDKVPEFGMPFALGEALGFTKEDIIRSRTYYNVYGISPTPALKAAETIAARLKASGQPGVAFYGDRERIVQSIGVGTGCNCDPVRYLDLKPDLFLAIDDKVKTWIQTTYAEDTGHPLVVINHGTSEEFGMRLLNARLRTVFPDYEILHLDQGCSYSWVTV